MSKYVVWGTGKIARNTMEEYMSVLGDDILYFTDSAVDKWGTSFCGKEVCPPSRLLEGEFDRILICCGCERDIRSQLIFNFGIGEETIVYEETIRNEIYNYYVKDRDIRNKKILVVGDKKLYQGQRGVYQSIFNNIVGVLSISELNQIDKYQYDYIVLTNIMIQETDGVMRELGRIHNERNIINLLVEHYKISKEMILTDGMYRAIASFPYFVSLGEEHADKVFWVIRVSGDMGLATYMNRVMGECTVTKSLGYIPVVDASREYNHFLSKNDYGKVNAWELFFLQPEGYSLEDIKNAKNIWISPESHYAIGSFLSLSKKEICEICAPKPEVEKVARKYYREILGKNERILAVKYRGTDYRALKPYGHAIQPPIEDYFEKIEEKEEQWGWFDKIFLMTESITGLNLFKARYGERLCYIPKFRIEDEVKEFTTATKKKVEGYNLIEDEILYYAEMVVASRCNCLIASLCSSTSAVLNLNQGNFENKFLFDLGLYGIDDMRPSR